MNSIRPLDSVSRMERDDYLRFRVLQDKPGTRGVDLEKEYYKLGISDTQWDIVATNLARKDSYRVYREAIATGEHMPSLNEFEVLFRSFMEIISPNFQQSKGKDKVFTTPEPTRVLRSARNRDFDSPTPATAGPSVQQQAPTFLGPSTKRGGRIMVRTEQLGTLIKPSGLSSDLSESETATEPQTPPHQGNTQWLSSLEALADADLTVSALSTGSSLTGNLFTLSGDVAKGEPPVNFFPACLGKIVSGLCNEPVNDRVWSMVQERFNFVRGQIKFTAVTDGDLYQRGKSQGLRTLACLKVKPRPREKDTESILIQEACQLIGWIKHAKVPQHRTSDGK